MFVGSYNLPQINSIITVLQVYNLETDYHDILLISYEAGRW